MHLICLKCRVSYRIPLWAMKRMSYREYSYCDKCHKEIEGKPRRIFARIFTRRDRK
jgi:RNA polymerase-binding transcription factor DksA